MQGSPRVQTFGGERVVAVLIARALGTINYHCSLLPNLCMYVELYGPDVTALHIV